MVKTYDPKTNKEVAVVVDDRPRNAWLAGTSVDAIIKCKYSAVYLMHVPHKREVKVHTDPINPDNAHILDELVSSATIRVTYHQERKLTVVDLSKYQPISPIDDD